MNERQVAVIDEVVHEAKKITTLRFRYDGHSLPGQFLMIWIPGVDEVPMSLSYLGERKGITVKEVGEASQALCSMEPGERICARGPFGQGFAISEEKTLCVGGGVGVATLMPAVTSFKDRRLVDVAIGALTEEEVIFEDRARANCNQVLISTDDGSKGYHGTVVDMVASLIDRGDYDMVLGCGPERMLKALQSICQKAGVGSQLSLERYMKCGVGLCGSCVIDGSRGCAEGPVYWGSDLAKMPDFGRFKRDQSGRKTDL